MGIHTIKLPDVGESVAETEFIEVDTCVGNAAEPDRGLPSVGKKAVVKSIEERRADSADRIATGLFLAAFVANVPFWVRVLLFASALVMYAVSEGFVAMGTRTDGEGG